MAARVLASRSLRLPMRPLPLQCFATPPRAAWACRRSPQRTQLGRRGFGSSPAPHAKKYTEDHEWIELSDDGETGTIGISRYAAAALGDVVYVELPAAGVEVQAGAAIGAVESVKSASDIMTPVSGTVVEANAALEDAPATINKSPEADGWIARLRVGAEATAELQYLMDAERYRKFTEEVEEEGE